MSTEAKASSKQAGTCVSRGSHVTLLCRVTVTKMSGVVEVVAFPAGANVRAGGVRAYLSARAVEAFVLICAREETKG